MTFYPLMNRNKIKVKKAEDKMIIFLKELNDKKIILNKSAMDILYACDGSHSIEDIINSSLSNFGFTEERRDDIVKTLKRYNEYGMIVWKNNKNPFFNSMYVNGIDIYGIGINDLYLLKKKFENKIFGADVNEIVDRSVLINGIYLKLIRIYYFEKNNKPLSLIFFTATGSSYIWKISRILYNDEFLLSNEFNSFLDYYMKNDISTSSHYQKNMSVGFYIDVKKEDVKTCKNLGFENKGILKYEADSDLYSMWIIKSGGV